MKNKDLLSKGLAVPGTILAWLPILAPLVLSVIGFFSKGVFHVDFLMPAELFPVALTGGLLLLVAALRARSQRVLIGAGLVTAVVSLVGGQTLAVASGLATGIARPEGWPWMLVLASILVYTLAVMVTGVGGGLLLRGLFRPTLPAIKRS
jgi:hypothetical protein